MKKWTLALLGAILALGITACGDKGASGEATEATNAEKPAETQTESAPAVTADELLTKMVEASQKLKSFAIDGVISQNITATLGDEKQEQNFYISIKTEFNKEPLGMYQEMKMSMPGQGIQEIKQYIAKDAIYTGVDGEWVKLPDEVIGDMVAQAEASAKIENEMELFKPFAKDMKVAEEEDKYVMSAELSGDGFKKLANALMSLLGSDDDAQSQAMMEQMDIKTVKVMYAVNKESFLPLLSDVNMTMETEHYGETFSVYMVIKSFYSYDEVGEIKVPQEVLDSTQ
ncbi:hypothetical protein NDS46_05160 [Paenibacillus thiaminolyticus]|uniref:DUF6612 family protein n=1 Tax=Paenibacillus thiaminolyticus TaxID=49283 RepID=UPI00232BFBAB|nr:DUF6612 family protein [Paenibacillus thiaminolyticus]WCF09291.1 hypothetical protein NDS46_05160 [Paenibacillus thiaminolyticus]